MQFLQSLQTLIKSSFLLILLVTTINRVQAQSPGGVSANLKLWLKADKGTNTTTNLSALTSWTDYSGTSNNGIQATVNNQPKYVKNAFAYNPAIYFDGINDYLTTSKTVTANAPYSRFVVYKSYGEANGGSYRNLIATASGYRFYTLFSAPTNLIVQQNAGGSVPIRANNKVADNVSFLTDANYLGTAANALYINGNNATTSVANTATYSNDALQIGGRSGSEALRGIIAEVINYDGTITVSEIQKIESYLAIKYGIGIGHDYISATGTVLYNADGTGSTYLYDNNIIGIGREDASELYQKQSSANERGDILTVSNGALAIDNATNTSTFNDGNFFITGNNGGSLMGEINLPSGLSDVNRILNRRWMGKVTGVLGTPTLLRFDPLRINNLVAGAQVYLIVADDAAFATNVRTAQIDPVSGYISVPVRFNNANSANNYITLAQSVPSAVPTQGPVLPFTDVAVSLQSDWLPSATNTYMEVHAKNQGFVVTRVDGTASIASPLEGMLIFDTSDNKFKVYNGTSWRALKENVPTTTSSGSLCY